MELIFSAKVEGKLKEKHNVRKHEVLECFANRLGRSLIDTREDHRTNPPTRWFIAETNMGRKLKVVYIPMPDQLVIKTAYDANAMELTIYASVARVTFC